MAKWVIGVDFGTASVRGLLIDADSGQELFSAQAAYTRWAKGLYCVPSKNKYRQHPLDYIEGLISVTTAISDFCGQENVHSIKAISFDTTGSTPGPVNLKGQPLALLPEFADNPNAMFYLWKDHTAIKEAAEINRQNAENAADLLKNVGGVYSSEWFWAKLIHACREDEKVYNCTENWVEHCDWLPFLLTGGQDHKQIMRGSCAAGHKALWSNDRSPLEILNFLKKVEPKLIKFSQPLFSEVYPATSAAGRLTKEWAAKLGLSTETLVGIGTIDAHAGAVGGGIEQGKLLKVMGTSTCDMMVASKKKMQDTTLKGISGQAEDSIIPGMIGLEAGQSAFGDSFDWFTKLLTSPTLAIVEKCDFLSEVDRLKVKEAVESNIFKQLEKEIAEIDLNAHSPQALDWLNGRRTPDNNPNLKASFFNIDLSTRSSDLYLALIEANCFGARRIVDTFTSQGQKIEGIIGLGGIAQKSPFIMQFLADCLQIPIEVHASLNTCALGSAMYATVVAGIYETLGDSQKALGSGFIATYSPDESRGKLLEQRYKNYLERGTIEEAFLHKEEV